MPRENRDRIPLVVSGNRILWAVGVKLSDDFRVGKDTGHIIKLTAAPSVK